MSTDRGRGRREERGPRHAADPPETAVLPEGFHDPYAPVSWTPEVGTPEPRTPEPRRPEGRSVDPRAPELAVPEPVGPVPVAPSARAQLVPGSDLSGLPTPRDAPDDAARRRRRAEEAIRALQVSESRLTDQIRAARAAGRTDGMRELLSRRLAVRARLEEARARVTP